MKSQYIAFKTAEIISNILFDCNADAELTEICLDDYGQCIHAKLKGDFNVGEIIKIGQEFGDENPNIHALGEETIKIVFCNEKQETITIPSITIKIENITGE